MNVGDEEEDRGINDGMSVIGSLRRVFVWRWDGVIVFRKRGIIGVCGWLRELPRRQQRGGRRCYVG